MGRTDEYFSTALKILAILAVIFLPFECHKLDKENKEYRDSLKSAEEEINELEDRLEEKDGEIAELEDSLDFYIDFSWEMADQCDFFDAYAGIITEGGEKYHTYDCYHWQTGSDFWIYNTAQAESLGYEPCLDCH